MFRLTLSDREESTRIALVTSAANEVVRVEVIVKSTLGGDLEQSQTLHIPPQDTEVWLDCIDRARESTSMTWTRAAEIERSSIEIDIRRQTIRAFRKSRRPYVLWSGDINRLEHGLRLLQSGLQAYEETTNEEHEIGSHA